MIGPILSAACVALTFVTGDLLSLHAARAGDPLPPAWTVRAVRGQRAPMSMVIDSGGVRFLRLSGRASAGWFVRQVEVSLSDSVARLALSWRVLTSPAGADLRSPATDDSAVRFFVVFAKRHRFDRTPRTLFYSTGSVEPTWYSRASFQSPALHVLRIGRSVADGMWNNVAVNPFADHERIWGEPSRGVVAIGLMQDTDNTRATALADVRTFSWSSVDAAQ